MAHTISGLRFSELVLGVLRIHAAVAAEADALVADLGLTAARWQVLSLLSNATATVPQVARRLGRSRQAVQRLADRLVFDGFLTSAANPDHIRSPLFAATESGEQVLAVARRRQERWAEALAQSFDPKELATACRVLGSVGDRMTLDGNG